MIARAFTTISRRWTSGTLENDLNAAFERLTISFASCKEVVGRSQTTPFVEGDMVLMMDDILSGKAVECVNELLDKRVQFGTEHRRLEWKWETRRLRFSVLSRRMHGHATYSDSVKIKLMRTAIACNYSTKLVINLGTQGTHVSPHTIRLPGFLTEPDCCASVSTPRLRGPRMTEHRGYLTRLVRVLLQSVLSL